MKLISLNTWGCRVTEPIFDFIKKYSEDTDIFCFQEVSKGGKDKTDKGELKDVYEKISATLPNYTGYFCEYGEEGHYYEKSRNEIDFRFGLACFVRKNLNQSLAKTINLHNPEIKWGDYSGRFAAGSVLIISVENYVITNIHGLWQGSIKTDTEAKLEQSKKIIELTESISGKKIICGDFNLLPDTQSIQMFSNKYRDLIQEYKIDSTRSALYTKSLRYSDYVFTDKDIIVKSFSVPDMEISDHLPLFLDFE